MLVKFTRLNTQTTDKSEFSQIKSLIVVLTHNWSIKPIYSEDWSFPLARVFEIPFEFAHAQNIYAFI